MKSLLQGYGFEGIQQDPLNKGMANMDLDDSAPQRPRRSQTQPAIKGFIPRPFLPDSDEEMVPEDDESDGDEGVATGDHKQYSSASTYIHNDNRVITKNVNSHNTNTENIVNSFNDDSTHTDIKKSTCPCSLL